jgi:hypothetical protein
VAWRSNCAYVFLLLLHTPAPPLPHPALLPVKPCSRAVGLCHDLSPESPMVRTGVRAYMDPPAVCVTSDVKMGPLVSRPQYEKVSALRASQLPRQYCSSCFTPCECCCRPVLALR